MIVAAGADQLRELRHLVRQLLLHGMLVVTLPPGGVPMYPSEYPRFRQLPYGSLFANNIL